MALPLPAQFMSQYYANSTLSSTESGQLVTSPYWGVDVTCPTGTDVYAVLDGKVLAIDTTSGNTHLLLGVTFNGEEVVVTYGHLSSTAMVDVGDDVIAGQKIAESGASGTVAPHLTIGAHFGWAYLELTSHRQVSKTLFPPDVLWARNPPQGDTVPEPTESETKKYRDAIGLRGWV